MSSISAHATTFADTSLLPRMDTDSTKERHLIPLVRGRFGRGAPLDARHPDIMAESESGLSLKDVGYAGDALTTLAQSHN
jgi:hypothetical protein